MCGRFGQKEIKDLVEKYNLDGEEVKEFQCNYNTDIGNQALVVTNDNPGKLVFGMFGFTPLWSQKPMYLFNARCEGDQNPDNLPNYEGPMGIFEKPSFRQVISRQRCVVPVHYFVEGPEKERLSKPYVIKRKDDQPYLLGGIWENWVNKDTAEVTRTFAILTTPQNRLLAKIGHHRAPLVVPDDKLKWWMDSSLSKTDLCSIMKPFDDRDFLAYPVSAALRKKNLYGTANNDVVLIDAIGEQLFAD